MSTSASVGEQITIRKTLRQEAWRRAKREKLLYLLFLFPAAQLIIFRYIPIYGLVIAFKEYRFSPGLSCVSHSDFTKGKGTHGLTTQSSKRAVLKVEVE